MERISRSSAPVFELAMLGCLRSTYSSIVFLLALGCNLYNNDIIVKTFLGVDISKDKTHARNRSQADKNVNSTNT